ncbi:fibronectin type III domain-containing protein [Fulvivirga kasyanovii]|uniref:Fibronectin type-III domain-containing protein n=1 Tax=Fulvivirga kasyanovii TaxID=396812 RepID=A0ABW9RT16_9BACT|nr:fibronectin type III domain-containing protein [Fulvivirga kasyanovii]MTI27036.1 hypothetical protein [Fulvivirga kasyanovii]
MIKRIFISFFLLLATVSIYGQTYPVQATTTLIPPYSVYIADYVAVGSERLALNIFLADINRPELNVRLRLKIEGQGIKIETKPEYLPQPLTLRGGVPERLTSADLAALFLPENLNFQGITRQQFERSGALPEGLYQFCFEVLEYNRGVKISNSACAMAWLILNDPPIINLPRNGEKLKAQEPQYVTFQWTPRHTGSPNSAFLTEYEFSLVEVWPDNRNPNDAILTTPPIYETVTQSTTLIYGPAETPLVPGRRYAFRIRAKSMVGIDELNLFKNNGYSQTHTFVYGDPCNLPKSIEANVLSSTRFKAEWMPLENHTSFNLRYRKKGEDNSDWIEENTFFEELEVTSLQPGTTYEYQVSPSCGSILGDYSEIATVTTDERPDSEFACGTGEADYNLENKELLESLHPGDYIYAGDFDVKIDSVSGSGGTFTGGGKAEIPFLKYAKVRTTFKDIKVNTDYRVIEGNVYTYWDPKSKLAYDGTEPDTGNEAVENDPEGSESGESDTPSDSVELTDPIDNIYTDSTGNVIVVTTAGDTVTVGPGQNMVFNTPDGGSTTVGPDGVTSLNNEGGATAGTGGDNAAGDTTAVADADVKFGPLSIKFAQAPQSTGTDDEGYCTFEKVKASFILNLEGQYELSKQISIDSATISFKKKCSGNEYKDIAVNWSHSSGKDIGKIKFIDAKLRNIDLKIDGEGRLSGSITLNASLNEDQVIDEVVRIKKGVNGDFSFSYDDSNSFRGKFLMGGIKDVNIDLLKSDKALASLKNGQLNDEGVLTGDLMAQPGSVSYTSDNINVVVDNLQANISYSFFEGLTINSGKGQFTLSGIKGLDGSLIVGLDINEDIFTTSITSSKLSGFGLEFSKMNIRAVMDKNFNFDEINGSLKIKHDKFNTTIGIQQFLIKDGELKSFKGNGQIVYFDNKVNITNTTYDSETDLIVLDANVEMEENGVKIAASVDDFTIDRNGNITFDGINANVSGQLYFGPVTVALTGETKELDKGTWRSYNAEASIYLKMKDKKIEKEVAIAKALVAFEKHKSKSRYRNIRVSVDEKNIPVGELYGIEAAIKALKLTIDTDAEYISGDQTEQAEVNLSGESKVTLVASLNEDKELSQLITLKKGLEGQITFQFEKGKDYKGSFDFGGIKKLNLLVEKNDKEIAALKNAVVDKDGKLSGKITGLPGAVYKSGGFDVKVDKLEFDVSLDLAAGFNSLKVLSGNGKFTVNNITGVDGAFKLGMAYGVDGNFNAELLSKESEIKAFGMVLKDLNLKADFTEALELNKIEGSLKASHSQFDAALNVTKFKVESGDLTVLEATGAVSYKDFNFELLKSSYANEKLSISAKVQIDDAGKLAVDKFVIDKDGYISVGKIAGELKKPMVAMKFNASFKEQGFHGKFTGNLKLIGVSGELDFGTESNYTYGYLKLTSEANKGIPLGPTGLQLTKVGGQLGYNYYLDFSANKFTGGPKQYNYLIGLTLGISDMANMFAAEGTSVVQFGEDKLQLNLSGNIKAPRTNPIIQSDFKVNYYLPDNTLDGMLSVDVNVPANSGFVFETTSPANLSFSYANSEWHVDGGVNAKMFREITFTGNTSLGRTESAISGYIKGQAYYSYAKTFNYGWSFASVSGSLDVGFNSGINANIDNNGISGNINVHVYGHGSLEVSTLVKDASASVSLDCNAEVSYTNSQGRLKGDASVSVQSSIIDFEESVSIDKTF